MALPVKLLLILAALLLAFTRNMQAEDLPKPLPPEVIERCKALGLETIQHLNDALKSKNLPLLEVDPKQLESSESSEDMDMFHRRRVQLLITSSLEVDIVVASGSVPQLKLERIDWGSSSGSYSSPQAATWSEAKAIKYAQFWYGAMFGKPPANVGKPKAVYISGTLDAKRNVYDSGYWEVKWRRQDSQGHPFEDEGEGISCSFDERLGWADMSSYFPSTYADGQKLKVTSAEAIAAARGLAKIIVPKEYGLSGPPGLLDRSAWKDWWNGYSKHTPIALRLKGYPIIQLGAPELLVVNPDDGPRVRVPAPQVYDSVIARLAWVVRLQVVDPTGEKFGVVIYIDTETGQCIGGYLN